MAEPDRISSLPLEIKISILSRLDISDAIRTSAVARSWRHLWTLLPCLRLDYVEDRLGDTGSSVCCSSTVRSSWMERAHHLVSSLRGPLFVFQLKLAFFSEEMSPQLQSLLDLLLQKAGGLETFDLYIEFCHEDFVIYLPFFPSLKVLRLHGFHVALPAGFSGFSLLTALDLVFVEISNDNLNLLINTSNNLITLVKLDCEASEDPLLVNLNLPLLRHLKFYTNDSVEEVLVIHAPCLEEAQIISYCFDGTSEKSARATLGLLTSVARVSSLNLCRDVLKSLSFAMLPVNFTFFRLRCLKLSLDIDTIDKRMYDALVWLLRSMPFLEEIQMQLSAYSSRTNEVAVLLKELLVKKHNGISCLNQTLKTVRICLLYLRDVMTGITGEKFFLLNAKVLKSMNIAYWEEIEPSLIEEMQKAEVTSSDAKVNIN